MDFRKPMSGISWKKTLSMHIPQTAQMKLKRIINFSLWVVICHTLGLVDFFWFCFFFLTLYRLLCWDKCQFTFKWHTWGCVCVKEWKQSPHSVSLVFNAPIWVVSNQAISWWSTAKKNFCRILAVCLVAVTKNVHTWMMLRINTAKPIPT